MKFTKLTKKLELLHERLLARDSAFKKIGESVHKKYRSSAVNLCRYILLRSFDLRKVHSGLAECGISSLSSPEKYVYRNVSDALKLLYLLQGRRWKSSKKVMAIGFKKSQQLLRKHTDDIFGKNKGVKASHIMVTLPTAAGEDPKLVYDLMKEGMDIARINLSHDDRQIWSGMIDHIKKAEKELNRNCKIYLDLSGPKIRTGTVPEFEGKKKKKKKKSFIPLITGDHLILHRDAIGGYQASENGAGQIVSPAGIGVSLPEIVDNTKVGDRVFFDDGKIETVVINKGDDQIEVKVTGERIKVEKLKAEKGINVPDTELDLPALTAADLHNLAFAADHADILGYSFVRRPSDVLILHKELEKIGKKNLGIVLKIENHEAFYNLPELLLTAMRFPKVGVMIARGDLAVELGFSRISEVQEQIMWLCEAAHIPVIWATQVLENYAKTGRASRAEVTDAAMAARAECVMLNKGPYIVKTCNLLKEILVKMAQHQVKKKAKLRPLGLAKSSLPKILAR
ncbi:MAG: hypothetical protein HKN87_16625 [Saprospiraceae bacterium]|nr:hypothetical protein [Saprospiraceae bacterium]